MTRKSTRSVLSLAALALVFTAGILAAGPLNPPAGSVTSTYKTLSEVEPRIAINATNTPGDADSLFKITQPGSYYLTGNISGVPGKGGIEIDASNVTIDLAGFSLIGATDTGLFSAIDTGPGPITNVIVTNGSVRGWAWYGISLLNASGCRIEGVTASENHWIGIAAGNAGVVTRCIANGNRLYGIITEACTVTECSAANNIGVGIRASAGSTLRDCVATLNTGEGFYLFGGCAATNCAAYSNGNVGIQAHYDSVITNCKADSNASNGIEGWGGTTITGCVSQANELHGIWVLDGCLIRGNSCDSQSGGAGLMVAGRDNRVEGNLCTANLHGFVVDGGENHIEGNTSSNNSSVGFDVTGTANLFMRNTAHSNTGGNFSIIAGNSVAPLVTVVANDNWPAIANSNHPFANFGY